MISSVIFYPNWAYPYIQKGVFLYLKWAFPKVLKGVVPKIFRGLRPRTPTVPYPPTSWRLAPPLRWSSRFHFKLRTNTWKLPMWKVEAFMGPVNNKKDPKLTEMQCCARYQWITQETKTNSLSSFSSSGSKLNSTLVQ